VANLAVALFAVSKMAAAVVSRVGKTPQAQSGRPVAHPGCVVRRQSRVFRLVVRQTGQPDHRMVDPTPQEPFLRGSP
jgi:hypothetical protein